jgi:hypothetical protein
MSDDLSQSGSNRGLRVLEAVRRRLKRVEIETHRIRADLAHLEAGHELGIAQELEEELDGDTIGVPPVASSDAVESGDDAGPREVVRVDLVPKVQRPAAAKTSAVDYTGIPTRIGGGENSAPPVRGMSRWVSPAWLLSVAVHVALLLACGSLTYAIFIDESPPRSITLDLSNDAVAAMNDAAVTTVAEPVEADSPEIATGDGPMNLADVAIAEPLALTTDETAELADADTGASRGAARNRTALTFLAPRRSATGLYFWWTTRAT